MRRPLLRMQEHLTRALPAALERHLREHACRAVNEGARHTKWVAGAGPAIRRRVPSADIR